MTVKYEPRTYAPFYAMPASEREGGFSLASYERMKAASAHPGYFKVKVSQDIALSMARQSPYPDGVKVGIMKQIANNREITLEQMRIILGYAARRAQHTGR